MKKIRIGNDIQVTWSIYDKDTGLPYDLAGRNITLYVSRRNSNEMQPVPFTIINNSVQWHFLGKDQEDVGTYSLKLVENDGLEDMRTVDVCNAFLLVSHTCACTPSQDDENVVTETVELTSEITPVEGGVGIGEPTATAESVPYNEEAAVTVESSGPASARVFSFHFEIPEGKPGQDGQNGKDGEQGPIGPQGEKGDKGDKGDAGPQGDTGVAGNDGHTPIVGVAKYTDGIYYWTVDGTWLKDSLGAMVSAQGYDGADGKDGMNGKDGKDGADGRDGVTPKLKIENDYWYVSYDNGATWTGIAPAVPSDEGIDLSGYATKEEVTNGLNGKVDKVDGKQLSTEDFTTLLKNKLEGLSNYDDSAIATAVESLRSDFDTLVSGDTSTAIKSFNDITAFLSGIEDSENLDSIIAAIEQQIASKQDTITDLDEIRAGAAKGATALQEHQSLEGYAKTDDLARVATTGSYNDLTDKPDIPSGGGGADITVDESLSTTSTNPVQNQAITVELNKKGTYTKPNNGIPKSDLANDVQESLGKADTALQSYEEQYKGTVTRVKINGSTKNPDADGLVDLGTIVGDSEGGSVIVDEALSDTSTNPVQNKAIAEALKGYLPKTGNALTASAIVRRSIADANTLLGDERTLYALNSGVANLPSAITIGSHLLHMGWDRNAGHQMWFSLATEDVYFRLRSGGVWGVWRKLLHSNTGDKLSPSSGTLTIDGAIKANDYLDASGISLYETFATKTELGDINAVLDAINGEVI